MNPPDFPEGQPFRRSAVYVGDFNGIRVWNVPGLTGTSFLCHGKGLHNGNGEGIWLTGRPDPDRGILAEFGNAPDIDPDFVNAILPAIRVLL